MNAYDYTFFALVSIIAINQFVIRSTIWHKRLWIFWIPQIINVSAGSYAILFGLPGVIGPIEIINWVIGGLFLYHFAQNYSRFANYMRDKKYEQRQLERARIENQESSSSDLPPSS